MKSVLVAFILSFYLLAVTELGQLLKLPVLMEHFAEHKTADRSISFVDFLYMHYAGSDFNENDEDKDMQLPFKSVNESTAFNLQTVPPAGTSVSVKTVSIEKIIPEGIHLRLQASHLSAIWQPPKFC